MSKAHEREVEFVNEIAKGANDEVIERLVSIMTSKCPTIESDLSRQVAARVSLVRASFRSFTDLFPPEQRGQMFSELMEPAGKTIQKFVDEAIEEARKLDS